MTPGPVGPAQALSSGTRINSAIDRMGPSLLLPRTQTLSASVELAPADDTARAPHLQLVISGMSSIAAFGTVVSHRIIVNRSREAIFALSGLRVPHRGSLIGRPARSAMGPNKISLLIGYPLEKVVGILNSSADGDGAA